MRIVVVGGAGNFGARIVRALRCDPSIELLVAGRRMVAVPAAGEKGGMRVSVVGNRSDGGGRNAAHLAAYRPGDGRA